MVSKEPLNKTKEELMPIISRIRADSTVGIDAQYTHAVIIEYLQNLETRLKKLENILIQQVNTKSGGGR